VIEAIKAERLADLTRMGLDPAWKDYAFGHAKQMAQDSPEFFADMPALLTAAVAKAQTAARVESVERAALRKAI